MPRFSLRQTPSNSFSQLYQSKLVTDGLTCSLKSSHETETEDDEETTQESGHANFFQLFSLQNFKEGDVEQGTTCQTL